MFGLKKYRLTQAESVRFRNNTYRVHRIVAVKDIPEHGVKAGDLGGCVSNEKILSHRGKAWITSNAAVLSNLPMTKEYMISGDVLVADEAILRNTVVNFESKLVIGGSAFIENSKLFNQYHKFWESSIIGDIELTDTNIIGQVKIRDKAILHNSEIRGEKGLVVITAGATVKDSNIIGPCRIAGASAVSLSKIGPNVNVSDRARIKDSSIGGLGQVYIKDDAFVSLANISTDSGSKVSISDNAIFAGDENGRGVIEANVCNEISIANSARVTRSKISGNLEVKNTAIVEGAKISGTNKIADNACIKSGAVLRDINTISGDAVVPESIVISNVVATSGTVQATVRRNQKSSKKDFEFPGIFEIPDIPEMPSFPSIPSLGMPAIPAIPSIPAIPAMPVFEDFSAFNNFTKINLASASSGPAKITGKSPKKEESKEPHIRAIKDTLADYDAYNEDIINLLKYPAMADSSIPEVRDLKIAVRKARRELKYPSSTVDELKALARELDSAFIVAETKVHTIANSHLDEKAKSALKSATQMLALACNESASDNEKRISFKAGMKQLEGVLPVSETAVQLFKAKAGLLEIEA